MESIYCSLANKCTLLNLEKFEIYIKIHINIAPTCFGLPPSSGSLYRAWIKLYNQALYKLPEDDRRPKHVGAIFMCISMYILNFSKFNKCAFVGE